MRAESAGGPGQPGVRLRASSVATPLVVQTGLGRLGKTGATVCRQIGVVDRGLCRRPRVIRPDPTRPDPNRDLNARHNKASQPLDTTTTLRDWFFFFRDFSLLFVALSGAVRGCLCAVCFPTLVYGYRDKPTDRPACVQDRLIWIFHSTTVD